MTRGAQTKEQILTFAMDRASTVGLEGLSIGSLASSLGLSKSGLFAHFRSKENLQLRVIDTAAALFSRQVVLPALKEPRGEPRVQALFENWLDWGNKTGLSGGCLFVTASIEFDDRPGAIRDALIKTQKDWIQTLTRAISIAVEEEHFRADLDADLMAYAAYSLMLGSHHYHRLLGATDALDLARRSFQKLTLAARA